MFSLKGSIRLIIITAVVGAAMLVSSCGIVLTGSLSIPERVEASTTRADLIELTWEEVRGADIYYVYRALNSDSLSGTPEDIASHFYRDVTQPVLLDTEVNPTSYFYRVSAGRLSTGEESALSDPAEGILAEEVEWLATSTVFSNPGTHRLAVDRTTATIQAYALTVEESAGVTATVNEIGADGTLVSLGGPIETVDGRIPRAADIAAAGTVYLALVADNPVETGDIDTVFLFAYDEENEEWLEIIAGAPQTQVAHETEPYLTLVPAGENEVVLTYRDASGVMVSYYYNGTALSVSSVPTGTALLGYIDATSIPGSAALLYEIEDGSDNTTSLEVALFGTVGGAAAGDWQGSGTVVFDGSSGNITEGSISISRDPAAAGATDGITIGFIDDTGVRLVDATGSTVPGSETGFGGTPDLANRALAIAAQSDLISVFYLDSGESAGVIRQFDTESESWSVFSPDAFTTGANPGLFSLVPGGGLYFAGWESSSLARIRTYQ